MMNTKLHIIYTESSILLSKTDYQSWQDVQRDFEDYKTSLGPWPDVEVTEYLDDEYPSILPSAEVQIAAFRRSNAAVVEIQFAT